VPDPEIQSLRVDESLYFPNARFLEDLINRAVAVNPAWASQSFTRTILFF